MMKRVIGAAVIAVALSCTAALAQTTAGPEAASQETAAKVNIMTRALRPTEVPENEARPVDLSLVSVPGVGPDLVQGVTAKAYTRYVAYEGRKIAQVVLVGVEKDGRQEPLSAAAFNVQLDLDDPRLDPSKPVTIPGDAGALKAALERLANAPEETAEDEETQTISASETKQEASSNAKKNDQAADYQTPDPIAVAEEPTESVRVISDGCELRIDIAQMRAIQQTRTETTKDGKVISEGECSDSGDGYTLQRSYSVCTDQIDIENRKATARYLLYYVDDGGARHEVTECEPDEEKAFPITEKASACTIFLDYASEQAVPQSALIYIDENNTEVQVRGCLASETKAAVPMVKTTGACTIRHDLAAGKSFQQGTSTYVLDGITFQAGGCTDTGVEYAQTTVYGVGGQNICQPIVNQDAGTVTLQSRVQITVDGVPQYVTDCTPDTHTLALVATEDGCANPSTWEHDLSAGVSYAEERFYYIRTGGQKEYVTDCQRSSTTYPHENEIVDWQPHDDQLFAYPLTTVYITPPSGRYDVKTNTLLPGEVQVPYELTGTETVPNGQSEYSGCKALRLTDQVQVWKRPNNTNFHKTIGSGEPEGPVDVCVTTQVDTRTLVTGRGAYNCRGTAPCCDGTHLVQQNVNKFEVKNLETGAVITNTCGFPDSNNNGDITDDWDGWQFTQSPGYICYPPTGQTMFLGDDAVSRGEPACPF